MKEEFTDQTYSEAFGMMVCGALIRRKFWAKHQFVFLRRESKMKFADLFKINTFSEGMVEYLHEKKAQALDISNIDNQEYVFEEYLCKLDGQRIINGWTPSQEELLAEDWIIYEFTPKQ